MIPEHDSSEIADSLKKEDVAREIHIRVASDLHLEGFRGQFMHRLEAHFLPVDKRDADSILVLAGDISSDPAQLVEFLKRVAPRFKRVVYVPGNHEYYRHEMFRWQSAVRPELENIRGLAFALDLPQACEIEGVRFAFCTLWGDGGDSTGESDAIGEYLNDFRLIRYGEAAFTVDCMRARHHEQRLLLGGLLRETRAHVVVTHHMPSYSLSHPRFGNVCTGGFAGKCDDMMTGPNAPALWIHGHTHDTFDRRIDDTRIVCNPAGYMPEWNTLDNEFFAAPKFVLLQTTREIAA
jgi:UDP-2,3-diacylglucosamine pyrophosphatase LpxH